MKAGGRGQASIARFPWLDESGSLWPMRPTWPSWLRIVLVWLCGPGLGATTMSAEVVARVPARTKPNILFIAIDDQNDWVGPLGGNAFALTPNMDRLARRGTTLLNAHCNAPLCNPSRTSLLLGLRPTSTGVYGLLPWFRDVPALRQRVTLPQYFHEHGYRTLTTGKIFHGNPRDTAQQRVEFDVWGPAGGMGVTPPKKLIGATPMGNHPLMDWGSFPHEDKDKGDFKITTWAVEQLRSAPTQQPFFLSVGYFLPHVPCYIPPRWMELIPNDERILPRILPMDRGDTPRFSWNLHWELPEPRLEWVQENHQWVNLVRSYLACTAFVDSQLGRLLDALEAAGLADNTIVVLWGDHGFHLGEKGITGKNTLWERATRVPLIFAGPGIRPSGRCSRPAELLDVYPSLVELAGLPPRDDLEGISLVPQLKDPTTSRERPALTSHNQGNHGVRSERWRYIRYADGSEELYDHDADPHEWTNVVARVDLAGVVQGHRRWLPKVDLPPAVGSAHRVLTYDAANDTAVWEGKTVRRTDPIPR